MVAWILLACALAALAVQYVRCRRHVGEARREAAEAGERLGVLQERMKLETSRRNAVLSRIVDAVLVFDPDLRIVDLNRAAEEWFQLERDRAIGMSVYEAIRVAELHRLLEHLRAAGGTDTSPLRLHGVVERQVEARGWRLESDHGEQPGLVVILHDVTQLARLEQIRQDFVANVSHELKTPITTIRGYVETLLDGECSDEETAQRFLGIVARQSLRLEAIIEDLLTLARLEAGSSDAPLRITEEPLRPVIDESLEIVRSKAESADIDTRCECDEGLTARINAPLFEQALVNLIDNAYKYSPRGGCVTVAARAEPGGVRIEVRDEGCGIESRHLPRLFERFYRVDPSRSRQLGGTGLGLAIVKHIVQLHGGEVSVQSSPGRGSTFTIMLKSSEATT